MLLVCHAYAQEENPHRGRAGAEVSENLGQVLATPDLMTWWRIALQVACALTNEAEQTSGKKIDDDCPVIGYCAERHGSSAERERCCDDDEAHCFIEDHGF